MSLIDKLEDLVAKVDTEYQEKVEAVILEIVPGCREGRGGQWVHYFVALVRESKGDHRGGGADGQGVWWQSLRVADG